MIKKEIKKYTREEQKEIDKELQLVLEYASPRMKVKFIEAVKPVMKKIDALWDKIDLERSLENPSLDKIKKWQDKIDELYLEGSERSPHFWSEFWGDEPCSPGC